MIEWEVGKLLLLLGISHRMRELVEEMESGLATLATLDSLGLRRGEVVASMSGRMQIEGQTREQEERRDRSSIVKDPWCMKNVKGTGDAIQEDVKTS